MSKSSMYRILVGLDLSSIDRHVLAFLSQNHQALTTEKIYFIHVMEKLDPGINQKFDSKGKVPEVSDEMEALIKNAFPKADFDYDIRLIAGDPEQEIREWSVARGIDLVVLGHKETDEHEVEAKKLVKKPGCSLLLIPEKTDYKIRKIGVAIDFSELSLYTLKIAQSIAADLDAEIVGFHTYQVPSGYHYSGKDHKEFAEVMEENARKDADEFLAKAGIDKFRMEYAYDASDHPAEYINKLAQDHDVDLLLMGSKGRTGAASMLLGSVAKNVAKKIRDIPLMIIKEKNENMDIVDALKKV